MRTDCILTCANGKGFDLDNPLASDVDFVAIAEHLAKEPRYNGATPGVVYSVAQHSVLGAAYIESQFGDREAAAYFLLHDAHEAVAKDDTTPKKRAIAARAERAFGVLGEHIVKAFDLLTDDIDRAIHEAAGLPWPMPESVRRRVKEIDRAMFVTEWRQLMPFEHPDWSAYRDVKPLFMPLQCWDWFEAKHSFLRMARSLLPSPIPSEDDGFGHLAAREK